jgi:hypothetical protein
MSSTAPMSQKDRLRRVVILCCAFARNLAYYRVGQDKEHKHLFDPSKSASANFWRVANSNSIDICVLEWCKLFADEKGKHYWGKVVSDPACFKMDLLRHLGLDEAAFQKEIGVMRHYRDKFLAHLDSDRTMNIPKLDVPKTAVWFYHARIVSVEAKAGDLTDLAVGLDTGYRKSEDEAKAVFQKAAL